MRAKTAHDISIENVQRRSVLLRGGGGGGGSPLKFWKTRFRDNG